MMEKIKAIIRGKPVLLVIFPLIFGVLVAIIKWGLALNTAIPLFLIGIALGIYFLDFAEEFFQLKPSPFRSIVFCAGFILVSLFIITSSGNPLASGLVLSLSISLVMRQIGQWQLTGNLDSWYEMLASPVKTENQLWGIYIFISIIIVETLIFLR